VARSGADDLHNGAARVRPPGHYLFISRSAVVSSIPALMWPRTRDLHDGFIGISPVRRRALAIGVV